MREVLGRTPAQVFAVWGSPASLFVPTDQQRASGVRYTDAAYKRAGVRVSFLYLDQNLPVEWVFVSETSGRYDRDQLLRAVGTGKGYQVEVVTIAIGRAEGGVAGVWIGLPGAPPHPKE